MTGESILGLARRAGLDRAALVDARLLSPWARHVEERRNAGLPIPDLEWEWLLDESRARSCSLLVCCLSCLRKEPDDPSAPGRPHALIAPFARAHYYRAAIDLLRGFAALLDEEHGVPRRALRLFSNSRMPEKPLLVASGLGGYGANGLAIVKGLGSLFVIAGAVLPFTVDDPPDATPVGDLCGSCRRCRDACPVGAIVSPGVVDPDRCLQGIAGVDAPLVEGVAEAWGKRLYGCQECQTVCPHNARLAVAADPAPGELGAGIPIEDLLSDDEEGRRARFRGSALGMRWIAPAALLRNAIIAAGHAGDAALRPAVARHEGAESLGVRAAVAWTRARLR
ncbi:MAG TPA: 4Fe-4S double cluster binding domain-containing protein [Spirochaetia bacterium]